MKMSREQFSNKLAALLQETYPSITPEIIRQELDLQVDKKEQSKTIIGLFVRDNLKKIQVA